MPVWAAMLLFPSTRLTQQVITSPWPFVILGGLNALLLLGALLTLSPAELGLSAQSLQSSLAGDAGFLAAWSHLLTLDLFAGVWIFRDARYWRMKAAPYLLATLIAGPIGLGSYLFVRSRRELHDPIRDLN